MIEKKHEITARQLLTFILASQIGMGSLSVTSRIAKNSGHDGWISTILAGIIFTVPAIVTVMFMRRYKNKSIYRINVFLYGKYIGKTLNILLIIFLCLTTALYMRMFTTAIQLVMLEKVPYLILCLFIILPAIYMVWYGLKVICRFDNIIYFILILVLIFYLFFLKELNVSFLLPVGQSGIVNIAKGTIVPAFSFIGFGFVSIFYPYIRDKRNIMKNVITANIITLFFLTVTVVLLTGFFGEYMVKKLSLPLFTLARCYHAPVIERVDLIFMLFWLPTMGIEVTAYFFGSYYSINKLLNIKRTSLSLLVLTIILALISSIPKDMPQLYMYIKIMSYTAIGLILILFICGYIVSFINKRGVSKE